MPQHFEKRWLPYAPEQLFALVADVGRYPEFLPWCLGARMRGRRGDTVTADLVVGYKAFRETFTSVVTLRHPERITVSYVAGPLADLRNEWSFAPGANGGCDLTFDVDFRFRSFFLSSVMDLFFDKAFRKMVAAFEARAAALYGKKA